MSEKEKQNIDLDEELSFIDEQSEIVKQEEMERSRMITLAIQWEDRYNEVPKWKVHEREAMIEFISPEDHRAMEYVSQNDIDLKEFRPKLALPIVQNALPVTPILITRNTGLLSALLSTYLEFKKRNGVKEKSRDLYRGHVQTFIDVVGDKESRELSYDDVKIFVESLPLIPRNRNKPPFDKLSMDEILNMAIDEKFLLAEGSWSGYATNIRSFIRHFTKHQFIDPLALTAIEGEFTKPKTYPYVPYDNEDLVKLFHSREYLDGKHKKASNYWCPLIALFTGARSNEICQLTLSDIKKVESGGKVIDFIDINQEEDKDTKTESSIRPVPINPVLIELGFLKYVEKLRARGESRLFPEITPSNGVYNRALGRWYGDTYRPNCGVESFRPDKRKVFHSFRHTLV
jgi:integrase